MSSSKVPSDFSIRNCQSSERLVYFTVKEYPAPSGDLFCSQKFTDDLKQIFQQNFRPSHKKLCCISTHSMLSIQIEFATFPPFEGFDWNSWEGDDTYEFNTHNIWHRIIDLGEQWEKTQACDRYMCSQYNTQHSFKGWWRYAMHFPLEAIATVLLISTLSTHLSFSTVSDEDWNHQAVLTDPAINKFLHELRETLCWEYAEIQQSICHSPYQHRNNSQYDVSKHSLLAQITSFYSM